MPINKYNYSNFSDNNSSKNRIKIKSTSCTFRFFKFFLVVFVATIILITVAKNRISRSLEVQDILPTEEENLRDVDEGKQNDASEAVLDPVQNTEALLNGLLDSIAISDEAGETASEEADDDMPGAFLRYSTPTSENQTYCKFNYGMPNDLIYKREDYLNPPELGKQSPYRVLYNVTEAYDTEAVSQITFATHMTANFVYFIPELLRRWEGLLTVAAFVPDLDCIAFTEQITQLCYCYPQMHRVSIHMVTHSLLEFSKHYINFFRPTSCQLQDSAEYPIYTDFDDTVIYPINVVRNVARTSTLTNYVLVADVELMPSKGLASGFLSMVANQTISKQVFALPIFEVERGETIPETKGELLKLLRGGKAIYFHGLVCGHCQKFPYMDVWMQEAGTNGIVPFVTVKRQNEFHRWEPVFIGTNDEPLYSEELCWEGLQDKMTQSLEMCLQDYNFTLLDNAFLCHWPGIRRENVFAEKWRQRYVQENKDYYKDIVMKLLEKYHDIPECQARYNIAGPPLS